MGAASRPAHPPSAATGGGRFDEGGGSGWCGRLMLGMAGAALAALLAAALVGGRPGPWLELAGLGLLLAAPWTLVLARLAAALRRRAWRRAALAAALLLLASLAWLRPGWLS